MVKHDDKRRKDQQEIEEAEKHTKEALETLETVGQEDEKLQQQLIETENKFRRALADYQNLEKRMVEERREWVRQANRDLLLRILPVLDTLTLAAVHSEDKSLLVSVQQFLDILKSEGVTKIETKGRGFDGSMMEAVGTGEGEEGKILEEVRAGFLLHDKLLRPAQVIVGR